MLSLKNGDIDRAFREAGKLTAKEPDNICYRKIMIGCFLKRKDYESARSECQKILLENPSNDEIRAILASIDGKIPPLGVSTNHSPPAPEIDPFRAMKTETPSPSDGIPVPEKSQSASPPPNSTSLRGWDLSLIYKLAFFFAAAFILYALTILFFSRRAQVKGREQVDARILKEIEDSMRVPTTKNKEEGNAEAEKAKETPSPALCFQLRQCAEEQRISCTAFSQNMSCWSIDAEIFYDTLINSHF